MKKLKLWLLLIVIMLTTLLVGCSTNSTKNDESSSTSTISTNDVVRIDSQKAVNVKAILLNPIAEVGPELIFELSFDTHSVNLSNYDVLSNVSIST
ncbi:MAG: hypothetical protein SCK28_09365, partial [Bacillota bacterium]|nr:hypothetical protein [Bacillota bacterium]